MTTVVLIIETQPPQASLEIGPTSPARACRAGPTNSPDFAVMIIAVGQFSSLDTTDLDLSLQTP
jgi:hypothetical protein